MMNTIRFLLFTCASPFAAAEVHAASCDDRRYCATLSDAYKRYIDNDSRRQEVEGRVAVAECQTGGEVAWSIPVLERKLTNARVRLPSRG